MEESHQEATEKEVERILGLLQTHFNNDRKYVCSLVKCYIKQEGVMLQEMLNYPFVLELGEDATVEAEKLMGSNSQSPFVEVV